MVMINENAPIYRVLRKLGMSPAQLAVKLKVDRSTVSRWTYPKDRGGTDGAIPRLHHKPIFEIAKSEKVKLTDSDFMER